MDKEEYLNKVAQAGYDRYLRTTKATPPIAFEEYRKVQDEETIP